MISMMTESPLNAINSCQKSLFSMLLFCLVAVPLKHPGDFMTCKQKDFERESIVMPTSLRIENLGGRTEV